MIYVDKLNQWENWIWNLGCRLTADTLNELHDFAKRLQLKPRWFQDEITPHYNLSPNKRKLAVKYGAIELDTVSVRIVKEKIPVRKSIKFRPLRIVKGKIIVASYMSWNKIRCADYNDFDLIVMDEYRNMPRKEYVYNHKGDLLFFFRYNPNDIPIYDWSSKMSYEEIRELSPVYGTRWKENSVSFIGKGIDCAGTPTFSHFTADYLASNDYDLDEFDPLTVETVLNWYGWFLLERLDKAKITTAPPINTKPARVR